MRSSTVRIRTFYLLHIHEPNHALPHSQPLRQLHIHSHMHGPTRSPPNLPARTQRHQTARWCANGPPAQTEQRSVWTQVEWPTPLSHVGRAGSPSQLSCSSHVAQFERITPRSPGPHSECCQQPPAPRRAGAVTSSAARSAICPLSHWYWSARSLGWIASVLSTTLIFAPQVSPRARHLSHFQLTYTPDFFASFGMTAAVGQCVSEVHGKV